jgi:hypothetical protein
VSGGADPDRVPDSSGRPRAGAATGPPRDPLIVLCAALIMAPTVVMLAICAYLTVAVVLLGAHQAESPMNLLVVVLFPVPLMLILMFEYHAVVKKSPVAALLVGALFLFPLIPGIMTLSGEINGLLGAAEPRPEMAEWARVGIGAACLALATFIGVVHLRWWRCLVRWYYEHLEDESDPGGQNATRGMDS